jgi:hypothetical protein
MGIKICNNFKPLESMGADSIVCKEEYFLNYRNYLYEKNYIKSRKYYSNKEIKGNIIFQIFNIEY